MTSSNSGTNTSQYSVYESLVVGISFYLSLLWIRSSQSIPLSEFYSDTAMQLVAPALSTLMLILTLFERKYLKIFLITSFASQMIITIYGYSSAFAFQNIAILTILLNSLFLNSSSSLRKEANQLFLAFLFLFAAFQKLNPNYLAGKEFTLGGSFLIYIGQWFPNVLPEQLSGVWSALPHFSIAIELVIAIGILIFPSLFSHIISLFLLILSYIHPPVLFVYILLLPQLISVNSGIGQFFERCRFCNALRSPYFWAILIFIVINRLEILTVALTVNFIFVSLFATLHIYFLRSDFENNKNSFQFSFSLENYRLYILPVIMCILFLGSYYILPSPIGFKMFSSRRFQLPYYKLTIEGTLACRSAEKEWFYSQVADASWSSINQSTCYVQFPTQAGLLFMKNKLCVKFSQTNFILQKSDETLIEKINCTESSTNQIRPQNN